MENFQLLVLEAYFHPQKTIQIIVEVTRRITFRKCCQTDRLDKDGNAVKWLKCMNFCFNWLNIAGIDAYYCWHIYHFRCKKLSRISSTTEDCIRIASCTRYIYPMCETQISGTGSEDFLASSVAPAGFGDGKSPSSKGCLVRAVRFPVGWGSSSRWTAYKVL